MMNLDRIKNLIDKLKRLSKSSNVHEAELAASRMQDILLKYNLTLSDVELENEEVRGERSNLGGSSAECLWRGELHSGISEHNFCRSIRVSGTQGMLIFGKKHNIEVVNYMYGYLADTIWRLAKESANRDGLALAGRYAYLNNFANGATRTVLARLRAERTKATKADAKSRDLVVVEDALVEKKFDEVVKKPVKVKPSGQSDHGAFIKGLAAGAQIGLRKGVRDTGRKQEVKN